LTKILSQEKVYVKFFCGFLQMFGSTSLWITNFVFVLVFFASSIYLFVTSPSKIVFPNLRVSIAKYEDDYVVKKQNTENIFNRDLFVASKPIIEKEDDDSYRSISVGQVIPVPSIPKETSPDEPESEQVDFLPPLQILVHGTIISSNPRYNRAFLENVRTKEEKSYSLGEVVDDAQIIFIGKQKVIFIRSNGQEETIYVNKSIAGEEEIISKMSWSSIIKKNDAGSIDVDVRLLIKRTTSVGAFLDELDLVTLYKDGIPVGCQVGSCDVGSLGSALGLKSKDVVVSISDIDTNSPESRVDIYKMFLMHDYEKSPLKVDVNVLREGKNELLEYILLKSSIESYKKSIGILTLNSAALDPQRPIEEQIAVEGHLQKGSDAVDNLTSGIKNREGKLVKKAGKGHAIYRDDVL
jgi:type II secretory pathway component PulC